MICKHLGEVRPNSKLFLAEGKSEEGFIQKALDTFEDKDSLVFCFAGLNRLSTVLKSVAQAPGFDQLKFLGIMLDAEQNYSERVNSLVSIFRVFHIELDEERLLRGTPNYTGPCPIGIYISPGMGLAGRIEDLVMREIQVSLISSCVMQYENCIQKALSRSVDSKSIVQAYISAWSGDLCGIGRAFQAGVLKVQHSAYDGPRNLVQLLIKDVSPGR